MVRATYTDKKKAIDIINETFHANPSVNIVIRNGGNRKKKISLLASYAFIKALKRNGVFMPTNKMGIALCFHSDTNSSSFKAFMYELLFAFSIPIKKCFKP
jgi:hypothetical protein